MTRGLNPEPGALLTATLARARRTAPARPRAAILISRSGRVVAAPEVAGAAPNACAERMVVYEARLQRVSGWTLLRTSAARGPSGPPCGACLQVLFEFAPDLNLEWTGPGRVPERSSVRALLPGAFGPGALAEPTSTARRRSSLAGSSRGRPSSAKRGTP